MKITLDIPNEHAPRLLALLADLMPVRLEPQADPAEGHPELPLAMPVAKWAEKTTVESTAGIVDPQLYRAFMEGAQAGKTGLTLKQIGRVIDDESEEIAETRWATIEGIDAADPLKVEMEPAAPVRSDAGLPFPEDFPELPPLPEGYSRWVYRGTFSGVCPTSALKFIGRHIEYWDADKWCKTNNFSTILHHIEAL